MVSQFESAQRVNLLKDLSKTPLALNMTDGMDGEEVMERTRTYYPDYI